MEVMEIEVMTKVATGFLQLNKKKRKKKVCFHRNKYEVGKNIV